MTGYDVKILRKRLQLTQKKLSIVLGIPLRTIEDWESGGGNIKIDYAYELLMSHAMVCPMIKKAFRIEREVLDGRSKRHFQYIQRLHEQLGRKP